MSAAAWASLKLPQRLTVCATLLLHAILVLAATALEQIDAASATPMALDILKAASM